MPSSVSITSDAQPGRPFNEQAALQELERLQRAIEDTRRKRKETGEAFDAFVRSFKKERQDAVFAEATPVVAPVAPVVSVAAPTPPPAVIAEEVATAPISVEPIPVPPPMAVSPVRRRGARVPMIPAVAGAALAIVAAIVLIGRPWETSLPGSGIRGSGSGGSLTREDSRTASAVRSEPRTPDRGSRVPGPTAAPTASAPAPMAGVNGELTAVRRVWVRIITDGNRVERELPAGAVVPLRAKDALTLRIGDAGAVKVVVNNRDQGPLGRDGEVVMRTFTAQTPAR